MLKSINKIPAGTFLVPMILSAFIYTFWPDLFHVGGLTEGLLSGSGMPFITGALSFFSGTGMKLGALKKVVKNHCDDCFRSFIHQYFWTRWYFGN